MGIGKALYSEIYALGLLTRHGVCNLNMQSAGMAGFATRMPIIFTNASHRNLERPTPAPPGC